MYYPFVMYDDAAKTYRMYYSAGTRAETNDSMCGQRMIGGKVSKDAVSWTIAADTREPLLYAKKLYEGDFLNPEDMAKIFDSIYAIGPCVIRDGSLCKMWYTGWADEAESTPDGLTNKINYRIGYATSPDGVNWTKKQGRAGSGSVFGLGAAGAQDAKGVGQPFVIKEGSTYRMWYEGFDGRTWRVFYATSADGLNWTRRGMALDSGARGYLDQLGARNPVVVQDKGRYEMWYQGQSAAEPIYHVLRATSPDGLKWTKVPGEVTLHPSSPVAGRDGIFVDSVIVQPDGSCRVFFAKESGRYSIWTEVVNP